MTDRNELRRLAEASKGGFDGQWYKQEDIAHMHFDDYIAAASPDVVLGLLDENEAVRLANLDCVDQFNQMREERDQAQNDFRQAMELVRKYAAERDQLRVVLGKIAEFDPAVTHGWAEDVREMARNALSNYHS